MTHGTDPKSPKFFNKLGVLLGVIIEVATGIFSKMNEAEMQYWIGRKESFRKDLQKELQKLLNIADVFVSDRERWRKFYQKHFSIETTFAHVTVPARPIEGSWSLIFIAQGLTLNQVYDTMSKAFKCWRYSDDLDASVVKNARNTQSAYAIWVRDGQEPDEKYLGKSANQADPNMAIGVTFLERMIMEIKCFDWTGKHLDIKGFTLCTGSHLYGGDVPRVRWDSGDQEVRIRWSSLDGFSSDYGLREAISR